VAEEAITIWTYSDDGAGIVGRENISESAFRGNEWPLVVDGKMVGTVKVDYGSNGWEFILRGEEGHTLDVSDDPELLPPDEDAPWWDEEGDDA
jgi:hypothetical protein